MSFNHYEIEENTKEIRDVYDKCQRRPQRENVKIFIAISGADG